MSDETPRQRIAGESRPAVHVARCALNLTPAHLDRLFDYAIPENLRDQAQVGVRIKTRFHGRLVDGFILELDDTSEVDGELKPLTKVVSNEPVMTPSQAHLIRRVADHYCGTFFDVARSAVPPRHATTEKATQRTWPIPEPSEAKQLHRDPEGAQFLERLRAGQPARASWLMTPTGITACSHPGFEGIADAVCATLHAERSTLIVVPDQRDLERLLSVIQDRVGKGTVAVLHSELGPSARYRNYLAILRGEARIVVGTRAAIFAPLHNLGLVVVWDAGSDLLSDPRAPYFHARDVAAMRAAGECALLLAGTSRSVEEQSWVDKGWLMPIEGSRSDRRQASPAIRATADSDIALHRDPRAGQVRLPSEVFATIRAGLTRGPVLVHVPRAGYRVSLVCGRCKEPVRCDQCHGPVQERRASTRDGGGLEAVCTWCGHSTANLNSAPPHARTLSSKPGDQPASQWRCQSCGFGQWRAPITGVIRTAEELGRAFPGTVIRQASGDQPVTEVPDVPAIVTATPGAEPVAEHGYAAAVILDAGLQLMRMDLRAGEEALQRWLHVTSLVVGGDAGGSVCIVGPAGDRAIQALVRLDPAGYAQRELEERSLAGFPPAVKMVTIEGETPSLDALMQYAVLPPGAQVLGPVPVEAIHSSSILDEPIFKLTVRSPLAQGRALVKAIREAWGVRSAKKEGGPLRIRVDPVTLS